jgi:hypothetical protein
MIPQDGGLWPVDPPGPFAPREELERWRGYLLTLPASPERDTYLREVEDMLRRAGGDF